MITLPSGRGIGPGFAPFVIAEVGSNWRNLDDCLHSISMAKACGADGVKFQAFTEEALYGFKRQNPYANPFSGSTDPFTMMAAAGLEREFEQNRNRGRLPLDWLPKLKAKADACGIEFMCSAFSPELVQAVDPYVNIHKVASAEMTHVRILEKLRSLGKPVILSTGASGEADIQAAIEVLQGAPTYPHHYMGEPAKPPVVLMYCVAGYPAQEVNLDTIPLLAKRFGLPVGYSDHSLDVLEIPKRAVERGAIVLEKHFTAIDADTPDSPHSLNVDQFGRMVRALRGDLQPAIGPSREESDMVRRHNRRLIATRDIPVGAELREGENFGIFRSLKDDAHGASPFAINAVIGKSAKRAIQAGDGIGPGDV